MILIYIRTLRALAKSLIYVHWRKITAGAGVRSTMAFQGAALREASGAVWIHAEEIGRIRLQDVKPLADKTGAAPLRDAAGLIVDACQAHPGLAQQV
mmetsp:Transcript_155248/g.282272  ORF Transcript_155248/g.282272 Transcript_155248/m.282272 type:complete len:97 (-) Transcript_155248:2126-2416(-)